MSVFSYGPVTLPYPYCPMGSITAIYEPEGNTDWCLSKYDFTIQSVISPDYAAALGVTGTTPAEIMRNVRKSLMTPRQLLSYTFNSAQLIPAIQQGNQGNVDAENGPKPIGCTITDLTNNMFLITYRITANYWENLGNNGVNQVGNNAIYNRWSEIIELDTAQYSKRTRKGSVRIRSDNIDGLTADAIRKVMGVVSVPPGCIRKLSRYTISPDGLSLGYEHSDQEVFLQPPSPAFTADGFYTECGHPTDICRYGSVRVHLVGRKDFIDESGTMSSFAELISTAVGVASSTLRINGATFNQDGAFTKLTQSSLTVDRWKAEVTCEMHANMNPHLSGSKGRKKGSVGINMSKFTTPPVGSEPGQGGPYYTDRGSAGLFLQAAAYYDPSLKATTLLRGTGQLSTGKVPGQVGKQGS